MSTSSFSSLPYLAQHLILVMLQDDSPSTLLGLRYVSKHFRQLVDQIMYRSIALSGVVGSLEGDLLERTRWLSQRLLDPKDSLSALVREITIVKWASLEESYMEGDVLGIDAVTLERVLRRLKNLQSFNWNSRSLIPKRILSVFQHKWPDARLGILNNNRSDVVPGTYFPMNLDLLSSPQLYLLDYAIVGETSPDRVSEFPLLKKVLLHSKNLRILRLNIQSGPPPFDRHFEVYSLCEDFGGPLNLQFQSGDTCPPLQELTLPRQYCLDMDHCMTWRDCMNWSCLTRLDLGNRCPENFLTALSGLVPNLKSFRFALWEGKDPEDQCSNMSVVRKFLKSIDGLEELYIENYYQDFFEAVWPRIKRHCSTLQILEVHTPRGHTKWPSWGMLEMDDLLERSTGLSGLSIDLTLMKEDVAIGEYNRLIWPTATISILTRLANLCRLRSLTLYIRIPVGIKQANAHIVLRGALELFHEVLRVNGKSNLENLEVRSIKYMDGWFGHDTEDVISAKVTRLKSAVATNSVDRGLSGTVEQAEQGLG